ncbi:hypothetical protein [Pseudomonas extremaustralis]
MSAQKQNLSFKKVGTDGQITTPGYNVYSHNLLPLFKSLMKRKPSKQTRQYKDRTRYFSHEILNTFREIASYYNISTQELFRKAIMRENLTRIDDEVKENDQNFALYIKNIVSNFKQAKTNIVWAGKTKADFKEFRGNFTIAGKTTDCIEALNVLTTHMQPMIDKIEKLADIKRYTPEDNKTINALTKSLVVADRKPQRAKKEKGCHADKRARIMLTDKQYAVWENEAQYLYDNKLYFDAEANTKTRRNMVVTLIQLVSEIELTVGGSGVKKATIDKLKIVGDEFNATMLHCNSRRDQALSFDVTRLYKSLLQLNKTLQEIINNKEI